MKNHISLLAPTFILLAMTSLQGLAQSTYEPYTFTTLHSSVPFGIGDASGGGGRNRIAVDSAGNLYVADSDNNVIRKVTPTGVVTTLAGLAGSPGSADGTGSIARFNYPNAVAVDNAGNLYVADAYNYTIRKVTAEGVVTTMAGLAGSYGSTDGMGSVARFYALSAVAVDSGSNVYVTDVPTIRKLTLVGTNWVVTTLPQNLSASSLAADGLGNLYLTRDRNDAVYKLTPAGVLMTVAGLPDQAGSADGTGSTARFGVNVLEVDFTWIHGPSGIAVDSAANLYVADTQNSTIRKVTPAGVVTTLAGQAGHVGFADGTGSAARFDYPQGVAVDSAGNVYVVDTINNTMRKGFPPVGPPVILAQPLSRTVSATYDVSMRVLVNGEVPLAYQWRKDGKSISGATNSGYNVSNVQSNDAGSYSVIITNAYGTATSSNALLTLIPSPPPGTVIGWESQLIPNVAPGTRFTHIAAGNDHSLALKADGTVVAWGAAGPVPDGLNRVVALAAGSGHSLALKADGTVVAWGEMYNGSAWVTATVPGGLTGVVAIAAGTYHSLALVAEPPTIAVQPSASNVLLSWPLWAQGFALQATTNLTDKNAWTTSTNLPVIVDSQNRVTDPISGPAKFYRLKK